MIDLSEKPRCKLYLKRMNAILTDPAMNDYWAALTIAESFSEKKLKRAGINFHTQKGPELLAKVEAMLGKGNVRNG